jgi:LEA14-like dessication related protein
MTFSRRELLRTGLMVTAATPLVTSTGCATIMECLGQIVKTPQLSLRSFKITKTTLSSFSVSLIALIRNPNPFGFRLEGLDWDVLLAGGKAARGRSPGGIALKAKGSSQTQLDIDFDLAKTARAIMELIEKRSIPLGINAVGHLKANNYDFDIPAKYETKLPMPSIPNFTVPKFSVKSASLSGVRFLVEPLVRNSNPFDLDVDQFDFNVKIGGRNVLRNKTIRNFKVAKKDSERVPLDIEVSLSELGLTAARLAQSPRLDWEVGAQLKSGLLNLPFLQKGRVNL